MGQCADLSWLSRTMRAHCLSAEYQQTERFIGNTAYATALLVGHSYFAPLIKLANTNHRYFITPEPAPCQYPNLPTCISTLNALPLPENSIDLLLLPHTLEANTAVFDTLQTLTHTLKPNAPLILFGLNPASPLIVQKRRHYPHYHSTNTLIKALEACHCDTSVIERFLYSHGWPKNQHYRHQALTEKVGRRLFPYFSCLYMIVARKKAPCVTPIRSQWSLDKITGSLSTPS